MASAFLQYVNQTGSPYHSVSVGKKLLSDCGFREVAEGTNWQLQRGGKYFVTRGGSDICAFVIGNKFDVDKGGFAIVGAHTDSPCLRLRPKTVVQPVGNYLQVGVNIYGGGLWHTWLDRDLGLAGKVIYKEKNALVEKIIRIAKPILVIPNLAIHLQTADERKAFLLNPENHLQPMLLTEADLKKSEGKHPAPLLEAVAEEAGVPAESITDMDLCLFDAQDGRLTGLKDDFISAGRIDNLASTWACLQAIAEFDASESIDIAVSVAFDHEECGSQSQTGADSNALQVWLQWIHEAFDSRGTNELTRMIHRSFLISADGVHGLHPNYATKHQAEHRPCLNEGMVIKTNPNQRYATTCTGASFVREICARSNVKVQDICVKNDSPCGTTIGPIMSSNLGIRTVDLGIPQLAMHSCREVCGAHDLEELKKFCLGFFTHFRAVDTASIKI
eukprot:GEMP01027166.1.p1 GENE.GEMP01027166.1~~GEMP01027166.1.p1  ORF type:complete len:446 (+),score=93.46 GEMP01027166.1:28-1365(+)